MYAHLYRPSLSYSLFPCLSLPVSLPLSLSTSPPPLSLSIALSLSISLSLSVVPAPPPSLKQWLAARHLYISTAYLNQCFAPAGSNLQGSDLCSRYDIAKQCLGPKLLGSVEEPVDLENNQFG